MFFTKLNGKQQNEYAEMLKMNLKAGIFGILYQMYFTSLPDHSNPLFDEQLHFSRFKKQNIIFNAPSKESHCDNHVGCLSFKTLLNGGEEWYGVNNRQLAV